ncbi:MAG: hypothetical protein WC233_01280 [Sphaerochaeta sp.]|jgi:hypothetical protein
MKHLRVPALIILLLISTTTLFAIQANTVTLVLTAEIPAKTTFSLHDGGVSITSNAHNFTYSVQERGNLRTLNVVAH